MTNEENDFNGIFQRDGDEWHTARVHSGDPEIYANDACYRAEHRLLKEKHSLNVDDVLKVIERAGDLREAALEVERMIDSKQDLTA